MKYVTALLLLALTAMGAVIMGSLLRDDPEYADGEPAAIVQDWLARQPSVPSSNVTAGKLDWTEEYLGQGKWLVSKVALSSGYSKTELTFEEWIAKTKGWDATRLAEYASDLSPEDQEAFQEQLRTYNTGPGPSVSIIEQWYLYESSALVQRVQ